MLVVDDDPNTLRFVRGALEEAGYAPLVTGAPDNLPGLLRAERPALVLLDLLLPGRDGLRLFEEIPELSDQPVIFISGYGRDETVAKASSWAPTTTSSSRSRRRSWRHGSARRCAATGSRSRSCSAILRSATTAAT